MEQKGQRDRKRRAENISGGTSAQWQQTAGAGHSVGTPKNLHARLKRVTRHCYQEGLWPTGQIQSPTDILICTSNAAKQNKPKSLWQTSLTPISTIFQPAFA